MKQKLQAAIATRRYLLELGIVSELAGSLIRAIVLARVLAPDQFGLAVALMLVMSLVEIGSDIGLERSVVRMDLTGDVRAQRDTLHTLAVLRGCILALLLLVAAPFAAGIFHAPEATPAFAALAIAAALRSFAHLGVKELARDYSFGADGLASITVHVVTTLVTIAWALATGSYLAMLYGIIAGQIAHVLVTHLLSPQRWTLGWHGPSARQAWVYGAPLIPNGLSQALKNIGDRIVVGATVGTSALALYSVTLMVGLMPRGIVLRYAATLFMPRFVNSGHGVTAAPLLGAFALVMGASALLLGLGVWALGQPVIALVFGQTYRPPQSLVDAVAIMIAVKILYGVIAVPALAFGQTRLMLIGSVGSIVGVMIGALVLHVTRDLAAFVFTMTLLETLALIISLHMTRQTLPFHRLIVAGAAGGPIILLLGVIMVSETILPLTWQWRVVAAVLLTFAAIGMALLLLRRTGQTVSSIRRLLRDKPPVT